MGRDGGGCWRGGTTKEARERVKIGEVVMGEEWI